MDKLRRDEQQYSEQPRKMVRLKKGEAKPEGACLMTDEEVLHMQWNTIIKWQPYSEMLPFRWGPGVVGGVAAVSGVVINSILRNRLGVMHFGRLATYAPTAVLPVFTSIILHKFMVTDKILQGEFPCTVCAAVRSGTVQSLAGGLYPMILGPISCIIIARKFHTYHVPRLQERSQLLPFMRRIMPSPAVLMGILLVNFAVGMALTERETFLFAKYLCPTTASVEISDEEELFR